MNNKGIFRLRLPKIDGVTDRDGVLNFLHAPRFCGEWQLQSIHTLGYRLEFLFCESIVNPSTEK